MRSYGYKFALFAYLSMVITTIAHAQAVSSRDDRGQLIRLNAPAQRIISLSPHLTENLFAIGAGALIVGTVDFSDYPEAAKKITPLGGYDSVDLEQVRALKPDLIVAWETGNSPAQLAKLAALGIPMFYDNAQTLTQVPTVLTRLGVLTGHAQAAEQAATKFRSRIQQLEQQYSQQRPLRLFYQVWDRPLMTINKQQIISDAMRICGARNVFANLALLVPTIDEEAVLAANPDMIISTGEQGANPQWAQRWYKWPRLTAVKRQQIITLPADLLIRMGTRLPDGVEKLCLAVAKARQQQ